MLRILAGAIALAATVSNTACGDSPRDTLLAYIDRNEAGAREEEGVMSEFLDELMEELQTHWSATRADGCKPMTLQGPSRRLTAEERQERRRERMKCNCTHGTSVTARLRIAALKQIDFEVERERAMTLSNEVLKSMEVRLAAAPSDFGREKARNRIRAWKESRDGTPEKPGWGSANGRRRICDAF